MAQHEVLSPLPGIFYRRPAPEKPPYKQDGDACKGSPFSTGYPQGYDASISGGVETLTYLFFGGWDRDEGPVDYNWKNRLSGRSNLTFTPSDKIFLDFGLGYERSRLRSAGVQQPVTTAITWSCPSPGCEPGRNLPGGLDGPLRKPIVGAHAVVLRRRDRGGAAARFDWIRSSSTEAGNRTS